MKLRKLLKDREEFIFYLILIISFVSRIIYIFKPSPVWWDTSIYIGMGKYLFSNGTIGMWENFRPVFWPILLGLIWKAKLNVLAYARILTVLFSVSSVYLVYLIGKKYNSWIGVISAGIFSFTPFYFQFTNVAISGIPALFFTLLAVYLFIRKNYFLSGLSSGVAFNFRFPHGITVACLSLALLFIFLNNRNLKHFLVSGIKIMSGFFLIFIPYLIFNYYMYNSFFLPYVEGAKILSYGLWMHQKSFWFYSLELLKQNFLFVFSLFGIFIVLKNYKKENNALILFLFIGYFLYFSFTQHKELRYIETALPFLSLLTSIGIYQIAGYLKKLKIIFIIFISLILLIYSAGILVYSVGYNGYYNDYTEEYYSYFKDFNNTKVLSSTPMFLPYSDINIIMYYTWETALDIYEKNPDIEYIAIDGCQLYCHDSFCELQRKLFISEMQNNQLLFNQSYTDINGVCNLSLYRKI